MIVGELPWWEQTRRRAAARHVAWHQAGSDVPANATTGVAGWNL